MHKDYIKYTKYLGQIVKPCKHIGNRKLRLLLTNLQKMIFKFRNDVNYHSWNHEELKNDYLHVYFGFEDFVVVRVNLLNHSGHLVVKDYIANYWKEVKEKKNCT